MMTTLLYRTVPARTSEEKREITLQWLIVSVLGGMLCGVLGQQWLPKTMLPLLERFCGGLAVTDTVRTLWDVLCAAALPVLLLMAGILFSGLLAVGQPCAIGLLVMRGMAVGIAAAACFTQNGLREGLLKTAVYILPEAFLTAVLLALAARDSLTLSTHILHYLHDGTVQEDMAEQRRALHRKWLLLTALTFLSALCHTALVWFFSTKI